MSEAERIYDRLTEIIESIDLIQSWSKDRLDVDDFMTSPIGVMAFNACVMRLQIIGEHIGKLLKHNLQPLNEFPQVPWHAIFGLRNIISHEYSSIDEEIIVSVINNDLIQLKQVIEEMLEKYQNQ